MEVAVCLKCWWHLPGYIVLLSRINKLQAFEKLARRCILAENTCSSVLQNSEHQRRLLSLFPVIDFFFLMALQPHIWALAYRHETLRFTSVF
jgi:hypothetical protein